MNWRSWWKREPLERAREFLIRQRFQIVEEAFATSAGGVDFIVVDRDYLVLVKMRSRGPRPEHNVDNEDIEAEALAAIVEAARLRYSHYPPERFRFDVLRFDWYGQSDKPVIRYFPNAAAADTSHACP